MEWTVNEVAERAGISGRTLRHYHQIGLLTPDHVGSNGYRYYGLEAVARLQRILLLCETGMPLAEIASVLDKAESFDAEVEALTGHLEQLVQERERLDRRINSVKHTLSMRRQGRERLDRRINSVKHTLSMRRQGREPRMDVMLEGFNDRYEVEVEVVERWGRDAFEASNQWWHRKSVQQQREWKARAVGLLARWREIQEEGLEVHSAVTQAHASVHLQWFKEIPGTPTYEGDTAKSVDMILGLAAEYESNTDFHDAFGTAEAAGFAAKALRLHVLQGEISPP